MKEVDVAQAVSALVALIAAEGGRVVECITTQQAKRDPRNNAIASLPGYQGTGTEPGSMRAAIFIQPDPQNHDAKHLVGAVWFPSGQAYEKVSDAFVLEQELGLVSEAELREAVPCR